MTSGEIAPGLSPVAEERSKPQMATLSTKHDHERATMTRELVQIPAQGKMISVPSVCVNGRTVIATGKWIRMAAVMDEELIEGDSVSDPELFVSQLKRSDLQADVFTFAQKVPDSVPKYKYHLEWDNAAVIPITSFSEWLEKRAEYSARKAIKRAKKLGVEVRLSKFDDTFVEGICRIYNDSPVRQGTAFWHYNKDFESVKRENSTYLDRSTFVGAYYKDELIGFIKWVNVGPIASMLQIISQKKHFDKKPTNALIAKAVEICETMGMSHLVYGRYIYKDQNSLTEFKRHNGFEQLLLPKYYIPLTTKGKIALKLHLHHPVADWIPQPLLAPLRRIRRLRTQLKPIR
ncbi:MAG: hypothetical protein ABSG52_07860 [Terriglobales bacterium]|jgi:hypothetical protein